MKNLGSEIIYNSVLYAVFESINLMQDKINDCWLFGCHGNSFHQLSSNFNQGHYKPFPQLWSNSDQ